MSRDYYKILDVPNGAGLDEIKRAYRQKAKELHPDRNSDPRAREAFILVNEAYVYLSNPVRRATIDQKRHQTYSREQRRRAHDAWVKRDQNRARNSASSYAEKSFEEFARSPIYKAAMVLNNIYDYVFIFMGLLMVFSPFVMAYRFYHMTEYEREQVSIGQFVGPFLFGCGFLFFLWYFMLREKWGKDD